MLVLLGIAGYLVAEATMAVKTATDEISGELPAPTSLWKDGYSRRFPGCVAAVLWPDRTVPAAFVVRWRNGEVDRIRNGAPFRRAMERGRHEHGNVIGACYRREGEPRPDAPKAPVTRTKDSPG